MTSSGPAAAFHFLIETLFNLYCYIILARFILQLVKTDFYNPVSQFVVKATNPLIVPMRRVIPGFGGIDNASIILLLGFQLIKWLILGAIITGGLYLGVDLLLHVLKDTVGLVFNFFLFAIFVQIIASWIAPGNYNPIMHVLHDVTEPLLAPARKLIPPMGGLDLSPMLVIMSLYFIKILFNI